ncbi:7-cyano-7-deazaguanine synthase QueC [uncultured Sunxiuqinia sp.]|uniref:7-cyano-7-deazaguanine synthase QueC n=1 Tax=uncultured Sunxiuqinia sp. TaxID=1573825 RepID=UPI002AA7072F|nr:7-cyano-7-deazaguanine synthase QueC [uncultured Sunxiuqinia sp.]
MSRALVVFSGGQDSTTCLYWAKQKFDEVEAVSFDYGQKHRLELDVASIIAQKAAVPFHVFKLDLLGSITSNALTNPDMEVEQDKPADRPPNTLVEGRNMLFLTYAAVFAKSKGIQNLVTGVGQADYSGYPDCRDEFIRSLNQTLNLSMETDYEIHTPLMWKSKEEIWQLSDELGIFDLVRNETLTCYNGLIGDGCGHCPACRLRKNGLYAYLAKRSINDCV